MSSSKTKMKKTDKNIIVFDKVRKKVTFRPPIKIGTLHQENVESEVNNISTNVEKYDSQIARNTMKLPVSTDKSQVDLPIFKKNKKRNKVQSYKSLENFLLIPDKNEKLQLWRNKSTKQTAESIPDPTESTSGPAESTPKPAESTPKPAESTPDPAESTLDPAESALDPAESNLDPALNTLSSPYMRKAEASMKSVSLQLTLSQS